MTLEANLNLMSSMKLNGMRQAYEAICQLPMDKQPDTHRLVATILDAEAQQRAVQKTKLFLRLSKLKYSATITDLIFNEQRNLSKDTIAKLADTSFVKQGHNILISGATGSGKSYLACALGHQACLMGHRTLYYNMTRL
jgi:DNA replication protein DnaC